MNAFNNLSLREKLILSFAAVALFSLSMHAFLWQPLMDSGKHYQEQLALEKDDLLWIQQNIGQLKNQSIKLKKINGSFISWLDLQVKKNTLNDNLKRIKPRGDHQVKIWMEEVNAKNLMLFLASISEYSIKITGVKFIALDDAGIINATIVLEYQP